MTTHLFWARFDGLVCRLVWNNVVRCSVNRVLVFLGWNSVEGSAEACSSH